MSLDPKVICPQVDVAFGRYFEQLGYKVFWEGRSESGERWYEICEDGILVFQISMPPPSIAELVADLPHLIDGGSGVGPTDYWIACDDDGKLRELLRRARAAEGHM